MSSGRNSRRVNVGESCRTGQFVHTTRRIVIFVIDGSLSISDCTNEHELLSSSLLLGKKLAPVAKACDDGVFGPLCRFTLTLFRICVDEAHESSGRPVCTGASSTADGEFSRLIPQNNIFDALVGERIARMSVASEIGNIVKKTLRS